MEKKRYVNLRRVLLDKTSLENHIKDTLLSFDYKKESDRKTFPIKYLKSDYKYILNVYKLLNHHVKLGIKIHSAGEWILDNFYIIEENVKLIEKELTIKKYKKLIGVRNGEYKGIPRIEILAEEIVSCTDLNLDYDNLEHIMNAYSKVDSLTLSEIECFELFLKMSIIGKIRLICEKIYISEIQKYKVENLIERLIENKGKAERNYPYEYKFNKYIEKNLDYSRKAFIEYLSYKLKMYGKVTSKYQEVLEKEVEKIGETVSEIIRKEHINVASYKVTIGNGIMSLKRLGHISFLEVYGKLNIAEKNLNLDPTNVYPKMDSKTKELYRREIEHISRKYKISEKYITEKILELCNRHFEKGKKAHVGYYLIDVGKKELLKILGIDVRKYEFLEDNRIQKIYISFFIVLTLIISFGISLFLSDMNIFLTLILFLLIIIPVSEIVLRIINYILSKCKKPKVVPKMEYLNEIPEESKTFVVIPTIISDTKKIDDLIRKIEVYYLANKLKNVYFAILGDVTEENKKETNKDKEIINYGIKQIEKLNQKYSLNDDVNEIKKFHFLYRERKWNAGEEKYIGWERKRGLLYTFNLYIKGKIKNDFIVNTLEKEKNIPDIKYIITLDSDTKLGFDTVKQMVGAMDHILNIPEYEENNVVSGYGIMQPKIGVELDSFNKTLFTRLYSKQGGIDLYSQVGFDIYQDYFKEGIFTGKGIYNVDAFIKVLDNEIPENTVLSHDLLEGNFLRASNISDVLMLDSFPSKYFSYIFRNHRWVRGDIQIWKWLFSKRLNRISKFKILDNIRRTLVKPVSFILLLFILFSSNFILLGTAENVFNKIDYLIVFGLSFVSLNIMYLLEFFNNFIYKESIREGSMYAYKKFSGEMTNSKITIIRILLDFIFLPYEAIKELDAIIRSIYRMKNKTKILEWTVSEETDKKEYSFIDYFKEMYVNLIIGIIFILIGNVYFKVFGILFLIAPIFAYYISKKDYAKADEVSLNIDNKKYLENIAEKTWGFFRDNINKENNYLITDNYQIDRKEKVVDRTSSTNIGLELIVIISAYDMKLITFKECISYLRNILNTVQTLEKWNGHLYNWYNIKTLKPLLPKYISTVDSGNFVGYLYIVKSFLEENKSKEKNEIEMLLNTVISLINNTNFGFLYNEKTRLFSIGFSIDQNKLTDSYYDLLASEARQASLVAIAKRDVSLKHWNNLSRTLTNLKEYKGLVSWSGTAFEYLMPNVNLKMIKGSLLDESSAFAVESQINYAKMLNIPWGISESAYNIKDLNNNYQYKAFGIPWLGLKRGLEDEIVVSPYSTFLSLEYKLDDGIKNLKEIENLGGIGKYGFYESIDFTVNRMPIGKKYMVVKCFMAHHQGLIFLSINNILNSFILRKRFNKNPEIEAVNILLEENMPKNVVITKEIKEKIEKKKLKLESGYSEFNVDNNYLEYNFISNENYSILINSIGESKSLYKDKYINAFKETSYLWQGIRLLFKNVNNKKIIDIYKDANIVFYPDKAVFTKEDGSLKYEITICIAPNKNVEIRNIKIENMGNKDEILECFMFFEPILSNKDEFYAHPIFNKLFLNVFKTDEDSDDIYIEKVNRELTEKTILGVSLFTEADILDSSFEIDRKEFLGRSIKNQIDLGSDKNENIQLQFSNRMKTCKDYIMALKKVIRIPMKETVNLNLLLGVSEDIDEVKNNLEILKSEDEINRCIVLSKARAEEETKYLGVNEKDLRIYRKFISYLFLNEIKDKVYDLYDINDIWKFGISGDEKIIMCEILNPENIYELEKVIKLYGYLRAKKMYVDLVIINNEKNVYERFLRELIENLISNNHLEYLKNIKTGVFVLNKDELEDIEYETLKYLSSVYLNFEETNLEMYMSLKNNLKRIDKYNSLKNMKSNYNEYTNNVEFEKNSSIEDIIKKYDLEFFNGYGGFINKGKEYLWVKNNKNIFPNPMINIIGNKSFGQIISDNFSGSIWYKNSRLNRITSWENDSALDIPNEVYYIYEKEKNYVFSLNHNLITNKNNIEIVYGFGYVSYRYSENNFDVNVNEFNPENKSFKIIKFNIKNKENAERNLSIASFIKIVLGEDEIRENGKINIYEEANVLYAENTFKNDFINKCFVFSDIGFVNFTNSMSEFFGKTKDILRPKILYKNVDIKDEGIRGIGYKINLDFEKDEEKEFYIVIGVVEDKEDIKLLKEECKNNIDVYYKECKDKWENITSIINIKTPSLKTDYLINGWLVYQTIQSRIYAKSAFYQSGGADGFRDQLQDAMGLKYYDSNILKEQIFKCARHQFEEGDVLHWWHSHNKKGVRTMFSDDLLWLVYAVYEYVVFENDYDILFEEIEYLNGEKLEDLNVLEKYDVYYNSGKKEILFLHLKRAIDLVIARGLNPFPKIGIGDWNDGFSNLGSKGKGESVWLGFFLYDNLNKFIKIYEKIKDRLKDIGLDFDDNIKEYENVKNDLKKNLNTLGWDGRWFKRAINDDDIEIGSINSKECKIDGLVQAWSILSDAADNDKRYIAMDEAEKYLVDRNNGLIKLFTPPFKNSNFNPGYIKAYPEGVRENGGQYTHAAIWFCLAYLKLGFYDKAFELLEMINPISHADNFEKFNKFRLEPYVMYADLYSNKDMQGEGGWNWYTGSSAWYMNVIIEHVLGLKVENGFLKIEPKVPGSWEKYEINYRYKSSKYIIKVKKDLSNKSEKMLYMNGTLMENGMVELKNDGKIYNLDFFM